MAKKIKITDKPTKKTLSKEAAKGVVGGADVIPTKTASTTYSTTIKDTSFGGTTTTSRTIDRTASTQRLAQLGKLRGGVR